MASRLNEDLMNTALDIPDGEIKIEGKVNPVYADAINVHNKKKKETEKILKDKKPELKKPFLGTKGETTVMPKTKEMKKLKLSESAFKDVRESMADAPEAYEGIFRVIDNMEHIIDYISNLSDEELSYADMQQSYNVLDEAMNEFSGYLSELKNAERKGNVKEAVEAPERTRKDWELQDKRNNKDLWSDIYNELADMKDLETPHRRFKKAPSQRYSAVPEGDVRIGIARWEDAITVRVDDESKLDFAKEVAESYGVEWKVVEHTSRYADSKYEMFIYPTRPVRESLDNAKAFGRKAKKKDLKESADRAIYGEVAKHFEYRIPDATLDVITDIVERAVDNCDDGYDVDEAIGDALDSGLIYTKDVWAIKEFYEDAQLEDSTYESLYTDVYSIVTDLVEDNDVDEGLTSAQRYNRKMDKIFQTKKDRDTRMSKFLKDNSDITDDELKKVQDDDNIGLELKNRGLHDRYWNEVEGKNESLRESYTEVDYICDGTTNFRVVGGGFNTNDALVSVEDEKGQRSRLSTGDVIEFYTWYDKKGNVIHEPSDDEIDESLNEDKLTLDDKDKKALNHIRDYRNHKYDLPTLHNNLEKVYGSKKVAVPRFADLDNLSDKDINKVLGESYKKRSKRGRK